MVPIFRGKGKGKSTDLEAFDLKKIIGDYDWLQLERAKGYEERRLIRGQIRIVKTMIENGELPQQPERKTSRPLTGDYDSYKPTTKSPTKRYPSDVTDTYTSYRSETTTETTLRTESPERYRPREQSPGKYPMRSTVTLTMSPRGDTPSKRSPEKLSSFPDRRSPEKNYPRTSLRYVSMPRKTKKKRTFVADPTSLLGP